MPNAWTEDDTEKLVALYSRYQCLWNPFHPEFSDKSSRYKAYKEIKSSIDIPGLTICDCIERIKSVKKEYCYELSKITAAIFCGKLYIPKAKWFKEMHMLFFPYKSSPSYKKLDSKEQKFNDSSIQVDNFLHSSFEKLEVKHICSNDTCGACKPPEIKLRLTLRDSVHSAPKLFDAYTPSEKIQTVDAATGTSSGIVERETQTDIFYEQKHARVSEEKKDNSTRVDDASVKAFGKRKIDNNFDIFGKSVAFQMRTIDIKTAVDLQKQIQALITKARLKTLESNLMNENITSICCCDCSDCKVMCKDETCNCGLTLKECLLFTKIKEKSYGFSYK